MSARQEHFISHSLKQGASPMLRVLVVGDRPDSVMALQLLLESLEHDTCGVVDGATTLKMAEDFDPDVVILDLGMPKMDGYEVARHLRQHDRQKPIIIAHSGHCTDADVRRSLHAGCIAHLCKPVDPEVIRRLLETCEKWLPV